MNLQTFSDDTDRFARHYEYDDAAVYVVDLGVGDEATVDTVDGTAIVVAERADGTAAQAEFELPEDDARVFIKNGVLTIEVAR